MLIYILILFLGLCFYLIGIWKFKYKKVLYFFYAFLLSILSGIRHGIGADFYEYLRIFNKAPTLEYFFSQRIEYEIGFFLLNSAIKSTGLNYSFLLFCISVLNFFILYRALVRFKINPFLCLFVYFGLFYLQYHFNILRQGLTVSFVLLAFSYIRDRKFGYFILYISIATCFHKIAVIFIPFYWFLNFKYPRLVFIFGLIISFYFGVLTNVFSSPIVTLTIKTIALDKSFYLLENRWINESGLSLGTYLNLFIFTVLFLYRDSFVLKNKHNLILMNSLFFGLVSVMLFSSVGIFSQRIGGVFYISQIMIIPQLNFIPFKFPMKEYFIYFLMAVYIILYFFIPFLGSRCQFLPYTTVFN